MNDILNCLLCRLSEIQFNINKGRLTTVKHPQEVTGLICSDCMQVLISSTQEKIRAAYQKALDAGLIDKAQVLENFLEEEEQYVRETKMSKRNSFRERTLRMVKPSLNQIRAQQAVI